MFALLTIAVVTAVILSASVFSSEVSFALKRLGTTDTVDSRIVLIYAGRQMFFAKPLLGWGFTSYDLHDWRFMKRVGNFAPTSWDIEKGTVQSRAPRPGRDQPLQRPQGLEKEHRGLPRRRF